MSDIFDKLFITISVLFGIPFGVFVVAYLDINNWLVLFLPFLIGTLTYIVVQFIMKRKTTWLRHLSYALLAVVLLLTLNRYIRTGDAFTVSCVITESDFVHTTSSGLHGPRVNENIYTYQFSKNEFSHAWLLRKYSGAMGDMGNHGTMMMTFRRGLFGINVLTATKWIDDDGTVYYERTDE